MSNNRIDKGIQELIKLHGKRGIQAVEDYQKGSNDLGRYIIEFAYGDIYARPGLDPLKRSTVTLANLIALGDCQEELYHHFQGALQIGLTEQEIEEIIIQSSVYCGFPRAINALQVWKKVINKQEKK